MVVNLFVENAVSPEGFRVGFAANLKKKGAKLSNQVVSVDNVLQCLCSSVPLCWKQEESRGYEGEEVTLVGYGRVRRGESANALSRLELFWRIGSVSPPSRAIWLCFTGTKYTP